MLKRKITLLMISLDKTFHRLEQLKMQPCEGTLIKRKICLSIAVPSEGAKRERERLGNDWVKISLHLVFGKSIPTASAMHVTYMVLVKKQKRWLGNE
jgi:hypothetical protein